MPKYDFSLDEFEIQNVRSQSYDTDFVGFALRVGDTEYPAQVKEMGDIDEGTYYVGLKFQGVEIPDLYQTRVALAITILNSGYGDTGGVAAALKDGMHELINWAWEDLVGRARGPGTVPATVFAVFLTVVGFIIDWTVGLVIDLLFANCDGPVVADVIALNGHSLRWLTQDDKQMYRETNTYPGYDSPAGCGSNSVYTATWSVLPVPSVIDPSAGPFDGTWEGKGSVYQGFPAVGNFRLVIEQADSTANVDAFYVWNHDPSAIPTEPNGTGTGTVGNGVLVINTEEPTSLPDKPVKNRWTMYLTDPDTLHFELLQVYPPELGMPFPQTLSKGDLKRS